MTLHRRLIIRILLLALVYSCCVAVIAWLNWKAGGMKGIRFIELEPVWHPAEIMRYLAGSMTLQNEAGRYIHFMLLVDYINIAVYTLLFTQLIRLFNTNAGKALLLPAAMAVCDVTENLLMSQLLKGEDMTIAIMANIFILLKLIAGAITIAVIISGAFKKMMRRREARS